MQPFEKERMSLIEAIERAFLNRLDRIQVKMQRAIIEELTDSLTFDGKKIKVTTSNLLKANRISLVQRSFQTTEINPLIEWMAKQYIRILRVNNKYFKEVDKAETVKQQKKVNSFLLKIFGITVKESKATIDGKGWLSTLSAYEEPYTKFREIATEAISNGVELKVLRENIKSYINPSEKFGPVKNHFYTIANDTFSQFDRKSQEQYAKSIGLRTFIYTGGLISTTRDFCKERNRKVFTIEEAAQFGTSEDKFDGYVNKSEGEFRGKNDNYSGLRDMGGHNCRHFPSFISKKAAIRRRPELKQYFEALEN